MYMIILNKYIKIMMKDWNYLHRIQYPVIPPMDNVELRKNPEHKSSGRDFKLGVPSLRFQAR